tara:strand:+ start:820 stop:1815 length:996 start_codon:yes stop_codon:yes gene_type:complete
LKTLKEEKINSNKWVKLICGASNEDKGSIEDLCAIYSAAGVDYIDIAADPSVAEAARNGINWSKKTFGKDPGLMISISDGKDIHFRKAKFDPERCPPDCKRPCENICPTYAISEFGISKNKCYGCGRCISSCPLNLISEYEYQLSQDSLRDILLKIKPDAVEIHTEINRKDSFIKIANIIKDSGIQLKKISVSCGLTQSNAKPEDLAKAFWERFEILSQHNVQLIWQLDGRPMSGDIAASTAKAAVKLWEKMQPILPPGLIQLAGGTNGNTYNYLDKNKIPDGIAFGSVARKLVQPLIEDTFKTNQKIYENPEKMALAIAKAKTLLIPWKS